MQQRIGEHGLPAGRLSAKTVVEVGLHRLAARQQVGRDAEGFVVIDPPRPLAVDEADAAGAHHAEKQPLLVRRIALLFPDEFLKPQPVEPAALALEPPVAARAVEHRIDRVQRPGMVEHDAVAEQAFLIEHDAGIVQVGDQLRGRRDAAGLVAPRLERLALHQPPFRRQRPIAVAQALDPPLHPHAAGADLRDPVPLPEPRDGAAQRRFQFVAAAAVLGAEMHLAAEF